MKKNTLLIEALQSDIHFQLYLVYAEVQIDLGFTPMTFQEWLIEQL